MKKIIKKLGIRNSLKIKNLKFKIIFGRHSENGIALILVVSIMAVLASIAAAFSYSMIMDQRAAANYMNGIKADYAAKAGIQHAIGVLKKDGDPSVTTGLYTYEGYDWYGDDWGYDSSLFGGNSAVASVDDSNIDNDGSTLTQTTGCNSGDDSRWIYLKDSQGKLVGRYAVLVIDESGKVNINTAGYKSTSLGNEGWTTGEINIDPVCDIASVSGQEIINVRYGTDGCSGIASYDDNHDSVVLNNDGIDNDGDNNALGPDEGDEGVDDSAEFYIARPYTTASGVSADTSFVTIGEVVSLAGLTGTNYNALSPYITAFSSDKNLTDSGIARLNINAVSSAMELYSTLRDAFDYYGTSATDSELAQMAVNIIDYRDRDNGSTRIDVEGPGGTVLTRYGVEGIRINEVMVRPVFRKTATGATEESKSGWAGATTYTSSTGTDSGIWNWTVSSGTYKVLLYGTNPLGNVTWCTYSDADGIWEDTRTVAPASLPYTDGADTVVIPDEGAGTGTFRINIWTDAIGDYWSHVELSQSPDCEYVEIVNISPNTVIMDGWNLEFPNGQVGTISSGEIISGDTVVLAIDKNDTYDNDGVWKNNAGNGISLEKAGTDGLLTIHDTTKIWQLNFTNTILEDIISDTVLMDSPLRLYDGPISPTISPTGASSPAGHIVDQVLWDSHVIQNNDFLSMERNNPAFMGIDGGVDVLNDSGIFDSWLVHTGSYGGTPTGTNVNKTSGSVNVKNSPFANIGEVADVSYSKTTEWETIGDAEARIKSIADRITVSGRRLDAEFADYTSGHWDSPSVIPTSEIARSANPGDLYWFKAKSGKDEDNEDTWTWYTTIDRFEADTYIMYVYGREGGAMRVRVGNDTALIIPSSDYGARFGRVVISDTTLEVAVSPEDSDSDSTYFDYILLTPASKTYGRININTASVPVLDGLRDIGPTYAQDIIDERNDLTAFKSIGEILGADNIGISRFKPISNLITTKSNVFKIICTGQSVLDKNGNGTFDTDDEVLGERKITVIYER